MTERYNVVSEGGIDAGYTIQQVQDNLCRIFKAPPAKIQKIFFSGSRSFVKRNVPYEEAVKYVAALKQAGAVTSLERIRDEQQTVSSENAALYAQDNPDQAGSDDPIEDEPPPDPLACPKCGYLAKSDRDPLTTSGQCPACGIVLAKYQALQAEMAEILLPEAQQLKEQILKVIKKALPQTGLYMIPDIPKEKLANAKRACNFPKNDELLGLLDCTAFGSAKECLVFGVRGLYMKDVPDFSLKDGKMSYAELARRQAPTSDGMFIVFGNNERLNRSGSSCPAGKIVALLQAIRQIAKTAAPARASQQETDPLSQATLPLKDRILEAMRAVLPQDGFLVTPDIPPKKLANASQACGIPDSEEVLGIIDCTMIGSAKNCLVFTEEAIYFHNPWDTKPERGMVRYIQLRSRQLAASAKYTLDLGNEEYVNFTASRCPLSAVHSDRPASND